MKKICIGCGLEYSAEASRRKYCTLECFFKYATVGKHGNHRRGERIPLKERFERYFTKTEGCWIWTGPIGRQGYGKIRVHLKTRTASRVSYELYVGPIPDGLHILHSCDNRKCVNPAHLRPGTHQENMADRQERYVYPMRGTSIPKEIVEKIRAEESTYNEIAKKYNVSHGTINAIKHRKFERFQ